jgi:hypothetical protein
VAVFKIGHKRVLSVMGVSWSPVRGSKSGSGENLGPEVQCHETLL